MIQLNLLPDVKLQYIKAQRMRKTIISLSVLITVISAGLLLVMLGLGFAQKARIASVDKSIKSRSQELKNKPDIDKVLTVQNQLNSLTELHAAKPAVANLFTYLNQVTPTQVGINNLHVDFTTYKMTITGSADALSSVNKYIDTLKFTKYKSDVVTEEQSAFNNIVLTSFGLTSSTGQAGKPATYTIDLDYNKDIFDVTQKVELKVPKQTTTRSSVDAPGTIFQGAPSTSGGQ